MDSGFSVLLAASAVIRERAAARRWRPDYYNMVGAVSPAIPDVWDLFDDEVRDSMLTAAQA